MQELDVIFSIACRELWDNTTDLKNIHLIANSADGYQKCSAMRKFRPCLQYWGQGTVNVGYVESSTYYQIIL
jgi:hypothetical protein